MALDNVGIYVPAAVVFPECESDLPRLRELLGSLSLTDTVFFCARANMILSSHQSGDRMARQKGAVQWLLSFAQARRIDNFAMEHGGPEKVGVFFRPQMLELLRWAVLYSSDLPGDGATYEDEQTRQRFAEAALICSDIWQRRVFGEKFAIGPSQEVKRLQAMGPFRRAVEDNASAAHPAHWLGRGWALFSEYLPRHLPAFRTEFRKVAGMTFDDYYICMSALMSQFMNPRTSSCIFNADELGQRTPYAEQLKHYLALECQTADQICASLWGAARVPQRLAEGVPPYDYRPIREKPIFRAYDGRAIILDPAIFAEKASVGPLFMLVKGKSRREGNPVFTAFGCAFEDYACDTLRRMFGSGSQLLARRLHCGLSLQTKAGRQLQVDACLDDVKELVLFEMKAVFIPQDSILAAGYEGYLEALRRKYGVSDVDGEGHKVKGVGQLARIVEALASRDWLGPNGDFSGARVVYPVLAVHDPFLTTPLHGSFLASEFRDLLSPDRELPNGQLLKGQLSVTPLIVISIEELEMLEASVQHFTLRDLLRDYSRAHPARLVSLSDYIASSEYRKSMFRGQYLADKGVEILGRAAAAIFPDDAVDDVDES